jgi:hypothetical protein
MNYTFINSSKNNLCTWTNQEMHIVDFKEWIVHLQSAVVYLMAVIFTYLGASILRKTSSSTETTLFLAIMLTGSLSCIFKVVPQHAIMILESNRSTRFVYCKGFTYNEYSKYPSCRIFYICRAFLSLLCHDIVIVLITASALLKLIAIRYPIWSRVNVTRKCSWRAILIAAFLSLVLNIQNVLVRNFPPSDDQSICLDTVQEHFSLLYDIMRIVRYVFNGVCFFTIIYTCVYAMATAKNVDILNKHKSSKLKTKYRMSKFKHVLLIVCFAVFQGSSFFCGGFIELNVLEPGSINQYFSLLSVVGFVICILLRIHIRDNDRRVLNVNCQCIYTHGCSLWSNISEASGLRCATPQEPSTF